MGEELSPIEALSFAYALTGNQAYATAVAPRLEALTQEDWWHERELRDADHGGGHQHHGARL